MMSDDELISGPDNELFRHLLSLSYSLGGIDELRACLAYQTYRDETLPPDECDDLKSWKDAAERMAGAVFRRSIHAAEVVAILAGHEKRLFEELIKASPHPMISEFLSGAMRGVLQAGGEIEKYKSVNRAGKVSGDRLTPVREFAREKAREYCERAGGRKPTRTQCASGIARAVREYAKNIGTPLRAEEEEESIPTIRKYLKDLPDDLFKQTRKKEVS